MCTRNKFCEDGLWRRSSLYRVSDKSLAPTRKETSYSDQTFTNHSKKKIRRLSVQPGFRGSSDLRVGTKSGQLSIVFFSRVWPRTNQHPCIVDRILFLCLQKTCYMNIVRCLFVHWGSICKYVGKVKVKVTLVQALRLCTGRTAHRGSRGIALPFHDHSARMGEGSASRPGRSFSPRENPLPIVQEAGWAPGPVWTDAENIAARWDSVRGPSSP